MRAWLFQDYRQKQKLGDKAPWSVGWIDPDGTRTSKRIGSKSMSTKYARKIEGQLAAGIYQSHQRKSWKAFRDEYEAKIADTMELDTRRITLGALDHFERITTPKRIDAVKTQMIDEYVAKRRTERGRKKGDKVSPATINKELRHIKAVLRKAHEWEYLPKVPKIAMVREPKKLPTYVTPEHFTAIYHACDSAIRPKGLTIQPGDWWRALVVFSYMTGWRVGEPLALRRDDLDLDAGKAITRHGDNKGKRDELVPLHPIVVEHLRTIVSFSPMMFPWPHSRETLWIEFTSIQKTAGIHLPCHGKHEHTDACYSYGFHDLRRAFATMNADRLSADALQSLMRHKSYTTTQRYINMARQVNQAVANLHVPDVLRKAN